MINYLITVFDISLPHSFNKVVCVSMVQAEFEPPRCKYLSNKTFAAPYTLHRKGIERKLSQEYRFQETNMPYCYQSIEYTYSTVLCQNKK